MKKRILISPHQRFLHLPLGPIFSPLRQGWFRRIGSDIKHVTITGSSLRLVDNSTSEDFIFPCAFIVTKRMAIYINMNMKARIEKKYILVYVITSLCNLFHQKHRTTSLQCVPYRYDLIYFSVSTDSFACCQFVHYGLFFRTNQRMISHDWHST